MFRCIVHEEHKPLGPVTKSPFLSLSVFVQSEDDGEAVSPSASDEKERSYYMAACFIKVDRN